MKYIEQRIEELEKEVALLKVRNKLQETNLQTSYIDGNKFNFKEAMENIPTDFNISLDDYDFMEASVKYPEIFGSWDDKSFNDFINENKADDHGSKMNHEEITAKVGQVFLKNSLELKIEKDFGTIISKFKILNHEWEMDGYGYVISSGIDPQLVITDHGNPKIIDKEYLNTKISEYKETIQETQRALFLIK